MYQSRATVVGYFFSQVQATKARESLGLDASIISARDGSSVFARLAQPEEWILLWRGSEDQAEQIADSLRQGLAEAVIVTPEVTSLPRPSRLDQRAKWAYDQIKADWEAQDSRIQPDVPGIDSARWGITEAAFDATAGTMSLLEHRYVLESAYDGIELFFETNKSNKIIMTSLPRVYELSETVLPYSHKEINEASFRRILRLAIRKSEYTFAELNSLRIIIDLCLIDRLAAILRLDREHRFDTAISKRASDVILGVSDQDREELVTRFASAKDLRPATRLAIVERLGDAPDIQRDLAKAWGILDDSGLTAALRKGQLEDERRLEFFKAQIAGLRMIARLDWGMMIEGVDPVYELLAADPANAFRSMAFESRLDYRGRLAGIAERAKQSELDVGNRLISVASKANGRERHIGYYLIDNGYPKFIAAIGLKPSFKERLIQIAKNRPAASYLGLIGLIQIVLVVGVAALTLPVGGWSWLVLVLALIPLSQLAVGIANRLMAGLLPQRVLPELGLTSERLINARLVVTVPTMIRSIQSIEEDVRALEIRYLANPDQSIAYGLLTDWPDSQSELTSEDEELLAYAKSQVTALQERQPNGRFFLYHRSRVFAPLQGVWMGHERKRGKIEDFLKYVIEGSAEGRLEVGHPAWVKGAKYCLTLDADTQLPPGAVRRLLGMMLHPLNRPVVDEAGRVIAGYGLIQPHVQTSYESSRESRFAKIFHRVIGTDPYLRSFKDLYFDLSGDGIFHGKAIYDTALFYNRLKDRFPDDRILSHDLVEGAHVRVAFASGVTLYDEFPQSLSSIEARGQRWIRGDWQILAWAFSKVPGRSIAQMVNELSPLNRWKVADNVRRSLVAPATLLYIVVGAALGQLGVTLGILALQSFGGYVFSLPGIRRIGDIEQLLYSISLDFYELMVLPYRAVRTISAIVRVLWRLVVSHRLLLQWKTAAEHADAHSLNDPNLLWNMITGAVMLSASVHSSGFIRIIGVLLALLWLLAPVAIYLLEQPLSDPVIAIDPSDRRYLRQLALQTFRFFYELMTEKHHFLPPDNIQIALKQEVATRTSPTNIGLGIGAWLEAVEFGFVAPSEAMSVTSRTLSSLEHLERYNGHFYNWYDTSTLEPLPPRFVSTVDSGNFVAALWAYRQGILELPERPVIAPSQVEAIIDALREIELRNPGIEKALISELRQTIIELQEIKKFSDYAVALQASANLILARSQGLLVAASSNGRSTVQRLIDTASNMLLELELYLGWYIDSVRPPATLSQFISNHELEAIAATLTRMPTYSELGSAPDPVLPELASRPELASWIESIHAAKFRAISAAASMAEEAHRLAERASSLADATNFSFLYNSSRRSFHIGFDVEAQTLDGSYYDLLASEARTASYIAVATGQVPVKHWWSLGRNTRVIDNRPTLLSWSGTMFEYLMPQLYFRNYPDTLLSQTSVNAVYAQGAYAGRLGIPWGISESAHSDLDSSDTYQYRAFGAAPLAIQVGTESGTVIAPYATCLAAMFDLPSALKNCRELDRIGMRGTFGFFEAVDFRRPFRPSGERGLTIFNYMAHHQGMILHALSNVINDGSVIRKFHLDNRVEASRTLLQERKLAPSRKAKFYDFSKVNQLTPLTPTVIAQGREGLNDRLPRQHILSNGYFRTLISADGSGFTHWGDIELGRWSNDALAPHGGTLTYIRDTSNGVVWSPTFNPVGDTDPTYRVVSLPEKITFERSRNGITSHQEVWVASEADVEIRRLSLTNDSDQSRSLEVTSYMELGLAPHLTQHAHPSFNRLFIGTEPVEEQDGILAWRRHRSNDEEPVWVGHLLVNLSDPASRASLQTDRTTFLGRDSNYSAPQGLTSTLGPVVPTVDPVAAVRQSVSIEPRAKVELAALTIAAKTREEVLALAGQYRQRYQLRRSSQVAWTVAEAELQRLQLGHADAATYQRLSSYLTYPNRLLKGAARGLVAGGEEHLSELPAPAPIVVAISETKDLALVRQLYLACAYLGFRGYPLHLLVIVKQVGDVGRRLRSEVVTLSDSLGGLIGEKLATKVDLVSLSELHTPELRTLLRAAVIVLDAEDGSLDDQLDAIPQLVRPSRIPVVPAPQTPPPKPSGRSIEMQNAYGGFTDGGSTYSMELRGESTPAPWANVIANNVFGTLVTERGGGFTWAGNSQEARITPWRNDPLNDRSPENWYVWNEDTNELWPLLGTRDELPMLDTDHRFGISRFSGQRADIKFSCEIFVPQAAPLPKRVRLNRIELTNTSDRVARLTLAATAELVLGGDREVDHMNVVSSWDETTEALLFKTSSHGLPDTVIYSALNTAVRDYTSDRAEVLGARSLTAPVGLVVPELSGRVGASLDPMAALRTDVVLQPGQTAELVWYLGAANNVNQAVSDIKTLREADPADIKASVAETWDHLTTQIQVSTPDRSADLLLNGWLMYQAISARLWGRTGYYQSSGAYGFRDQLQDVMGMVYTAPEYVREHIIIAAHHQFLEGDVQHWWQPHSRWGLRSRISDDRLWLPYVVERYVSVTGDASILDAMAPYIDGPVLAPGQKDAYFEAELSAHEGTILEHCLRAISISQTQGEHGLPLIGTGDWCDGYDRVGIEGKGESLWLAWFTATVEEEMAAMLERHKRGTGSILSDLRSHAAMLKKNAEANGWDGAWYLRAFYDDGTPLGSSDSDEGQIDSLAQSWAVIASGNDKKRQHVAIDSALSYLVDREHQVVRLLSPSFDKTEKDPGYIRGYLPGVRENGGQYTHGSIWLAIACARIGRSDDAVELLQIMNPALHAATPSMLQRYMIEPYVTAGDVYSLPGHVGMGGWSWYTGSAAWYYRAWIEEILGLKVEGNSLQLAPSIPSSWPGFEITYRHGSSVYSIEVINKPVAPDKSQELDGARSSRKPVKLVDDGNNHRLRIWLG